VPPLGEVELCSMISHPTSGIVIVLVDYAAADDNDDDDDGLHTLLQP